MIVGRDQIGDLIYKFVNSYCDKIKPSYVWNRNEKSVGQRVCKIVAEGYFALCVAEIVNAYSSRTTTDNIIYLFAAIFCKVKISSGAES